MNTKRTKHNKKLAVQNSKKMNRILQKIDLLIEKAEDVVAYVGPERCLTDEEYQAREDAHHQYDDWVNEELDKHDNYVDYDPAIELIIQARGYFPCKDKK